MYNANLGNIKALKEYAKVNVQSGIESASPHRLIQMLIDGALAKLSQAKGHIKNNDIEKKGNELSMAISIIGGLRDSLDHEKGGSIANNLEDLYQYMTYRLMEANLKNDLQIIEEVHALLMELKTAWDGLAPKPEHQSTEPSQFEQPAA